MVEEYFNKKGYFSNSFLKALAEDPKSAKAIIDGTSVSESEALTNGSLFDCLITTPDKFANRYVIYSGKKPTDKLLSFANAYISIAKENSSNEGFDKNNAIMTARAESGFDNRLLADTVIKKFKDECDDYCTFVIENIDKIIIDQETYNKYLRLVDITKSSPYLTNIFEDNLNIIVLFQVEIYITTPKFTGKCLIDCLVIDLLNKTITPYDFKTFEGSFENNYWKYKYYYQESWYSFILETLRNPEWFIECSIPEELKLIHTGEYTIEQFKFIAVDKSEYKEVEIFESYKNIIEDVFFKGFINKGDYNVHIKSIESLIEEAKYRVTIDNWVTDYQMLTKGIKKLWL